MDQVLTTHRTGAQAEFLLSQVASQMETSTGMLTVHGRVGDPPRILTSLNMPDSLASTMALSIDDDLAAPSEVNGTDRQGVKWPWTALRDGDDITYVSFLCRVTPLHAIAMTACHAGHAMRWDQSVYMQLKNWVEPFLALLWHAEHEHAQREGLARAIDRCDFGLILLDADGVPWFINARAQKLLDRGDGIRRAGQAISASDFDDAVRLQTAIRHDSGNGDTFRVLLLRRERSRPLIAVVASLDHQPDLSGKSALALYIVDPDRDSRSMVSALCRAYGLTATEALLAVHLVEGTTVEDAAQSMHIQTQTARAYLKHIFAKTGTHRQAELVRAILSCIVHII